MFPRLFKPHSPFSWLSTPHADTLQFERTARWAVKTRRPGVCVRDGSVSSPPRLSPPQRCSTQITAGPELRPGFIQAGMTRRAGMSWTSPALVMSDLNGWAALLMTGGQVHWVCVSGGGLKNTLTGKIFWSNYDSNCMLSNLISSFTIY